MNKRKPPRTQTYMEAEVAPKSSARLSPEIKAKIGQQLRGMYSDVVNEGVPDRFAEILRRLDESGSDQDDAVRKAKNEGSNGSTQ